ncbi:MAG: hypothetical protein IT236_03840 [Bacteroidia bacterium]|nr:hypothetical protein [Bacteroidia bacterium]
MSAHLKIKSTNMGLFSAIFSGFQTERVAPFNTPFLNYSYDLLFCDNTANYKNEMTIPLYPWDELFSAETGHLDKVKAISQNSLLESRPRLVACKMLTDAGVEIIDCELLGLVIELHHKNQFDVLAAYSDLSLYYIHHNERLFNCESSNEKSDELIGKLFNYGNRCVDCFEPRFKERSNAPASGHARISLLCTNGVFVKEGPYNQLQKDLQSGTIIETTVQLMLHLTEQRQRQNKRDYGKLAS